MRVKGTGVAHTGDVVPLDGIKGPGSANTYFDGYAYNKQTRLYWLKDFAYLQIYCL